MILHITNDFAGSVIYMNLIKELDRLNNMSDKLFILQ